MLTARRGFIDALADPAGGRLRRAGEMAVACALVVVVSMTFELPEPALSAYLIFFAAKDNAGQSIVTAMVFILAVAVAIGLLVPLVALTADIPGARLFIVVAVSFSFFFLAVTSKLAPLASTLGLVVAYALYLLQSVPAGELSVRILLYLMLVVAMPMGTFIAYNVAFGRRPDTIVLRAVEDRLRAVAAALGGSGPVPSPGGGNTRLLGALKMTALFRYRPPEAVARLKDMVVLSYALVLTTSALLRGEDATAPREALAARADRLAAAVRGALAVPSTRAAAERPASVRSGRLDDVLTDLLARLERVVVSGEAAGRAAAPPKTASSGFFAPDAFSSPRFVIHALKGTLAVTICYLTIVLLDWSKIATCIVTCFVVSLPTLGETAQKLTLRITGCLVGASAGLLAIVLVLPDTTSITSLVLVIALVTLPAAWIAVGSPAVSYIGFQIAFATYLCILQGPEPAFELTEARDRIIGILFGDVVTFLVFSNLYPASILARLKGDVLALVAKCRDVIAAAADGESMVAKAAVVAEAEALLDRIGTETEAFGYEGASSPAVRLRSGAVRLGLSSLRELTGGIARLAAYPPPADGPDDTDAWRRECEALEHRLGLVTSRLSNLPQGTSDPAGSPVEGSRPPRGDEPGRTGALDAVWTGTDAVSASLRRYGDLLRAGDDAHA